MLKRNKLDVYKQLTDVIDVIRTDLNEIRKREDGDTQKDIMTPPTDDKPNDIVYFKSEKPRNAFGEIIPDIKASLRTDSGTEFRGVFHKWLYDENILHRVAERIATNNLQMLKI